MTPQPPDPQPTHPRLRLGLFWWLVFIALMIWNIFSYLPTTQTAVKIPYSTFLQQVKQGNVTQVTISGNEITGDFTNPFSWPVPTPGAAPDTSANAPTPADYTAFSTLFPDTVGDPSLILLLEANQVAITAQSPAVPWFTLLLTDGLPFILLLVLMVWMGRQAMRSQNGLFSFGRSRPRQTVADQPKVTFEDVAGADEAKRDLQEVVEFLRHPEKYHELGAKIPRGVLLVGPPGTGKTLLARAVAGEANVPFFNLSASEFVEMFVGVGASRVRDLFTQAKQASPAIIFIDELDAVGRRRGTGLGAVNDEREQTLNQLLVELDGFDERHEVILLAATNRPDVLDPALLRPGRFDREVMVGAPDRKGRLGILTIHTRGLRLADDVRLETVAGVTAGMSGADLANLCNEAALLAARLGHAAIQMNDFETALDKIILGEARPLIMSEKDRKVIAYHEAGHAITAWFTPDADSVHKVTIIPHGRALGVTEQVPGEDKYNYGRKYLMTRLAVMFGGRVAEEIAIGEITTGAENDLQQATRLARRMVTRWAMTNFGLMAVDEDEEQPFLGYEIAQGRSHSEATAARVDNEIQTLLKERYEFTRHCLSTHREALNKLVNALLDSETVTQEEMISLLGPRPANDESASILGTLPAQNGKVKVA
ncbi:MAG: ATP-dependent metallopeptidase FtsH/Yme1/Tma family protein [Anaerolineales bacterium]|nr:ATP-dependent metallopeptidase FtsH/Yme1/Tma family protein [Anaerolineales bacterium]